jgi:hypothetical protein
VLVPVLVLVQVKVPMLVLLGTNPGSAHEVSHKETRVVHFHDSCSDRNEQE